MTQQLEEYRDILELQSDSDMMEDADAPLPSQMEPASTSSKLPRWMFQQRRNRHEILQRIITIAQPRLTVRYVSCLLLIYYVAYCFLRGSPLFASKLPEYSGPYQVGTIDVETPVTERRNISEVTYKANGQAAFELKTVLTSLFYPAADEPRSNVAPHYWISKPISATAAGYARAAHMDNFVMRGLLTFALWVIAGRIDIRARVDVPLADVPRKGGGHGFPVMIFSHGTASSRTDYTHFCGELASHGVVVAAIEHRDGSGPASLFMNRDGKEVDRIMYMRPSDLASTAPMDNEALKRQQLAFREAEIEEVIHFIKEIHAGWNSSNNYRHEGLNSLPDWAGKLDCEHLVIAGHSYGATGALQALKGAPQDKRRPAAGGIILDPGKSSGQLNGDIDVPILVVHSNSWSKQHTVFFGRPHFETVYEIVQNVLVRVGASWFVTSLGTSHPSVTDAPLIEPLLLSWTTGATIDAKTGVTEYATVSLEFIDYLLSGKRSGVLAQTVSHPKYDFDNRTDEQKQDQNSDIFKYWQIHIAPKLE